MATVASVLALSGLWAGLAHASDLSGYAANESGGTIVSVDLATGALGQPIAVGAQPDAIAIAPTGPTAYVADYGSSSVVAVDLASGQVTPEVSLPDAPSAIALSPDGRTAYVVSSDGMLFPLELKNDSLGQAIAIPAGSNAISISPDGTTAYVSDSLTAALTAVPLSGDASQTQTSLASTTPDGIAVSPDGSTVYLTSATGGTLTPLSLSGGVLGTPIYLGYTPSAVALSEDGTTAYATDSVAGVVVPVTLQTGTVGTPIPLGIAPAAFALVPLDSTADAPTPSGSTRLSGKSVKFGNQRLTLTTTASMAASGASTVASACVARNTTLSAKLTRRTRRTGARLSFMRATFTLESQISTVRALPSTVELALDQLNSGRYTLSVRAVFSEMVSAHGRRKRVRLTFSRRVNQRITIC